MSNPQIIRIGTREAPWPAGKRTGSRRRLTSFGAAVELVLISTQGDVKSGPIGAIGTQGVFTKELQRALLDDEIDLAVHSLKDLPTDEVPGLSLAAVPPRERCGDVLVSNHFDSLEALPQQATIGTGSARRRAQLLYARGDLNVIDIRGNVDTRLKKLDDGDYDAIILAEAGLARLGFDDRIRCVLPKEVMLPAIGQGALGLECRNEDAATRNAVFQLNNEQSHAAVLAERALLATLRGGCLAPIGAWGRLTTTKCCSTPWFSITKARNVSWLTAAPPATTPLPLELRSQSNFWIKGAADLISASRA